MERNLKKKVYASPEVELILVEAGQEILQASSASSDGIHPFEGGDTTGWFN